jgi:hypothetical protein
MVFNHQISPKNIMKSSNFGEKIKIKIKFQHFYVKLQ